MLNLARLWDLHNKVYIGHFDPVALLPFFGELLRELESSRKELAELKTPRPCGALSRAQMIQAEREKLQLPLFQEVHS